jgi:type 1 fimbria pilin
MKYFTQNIAALTAISAVMLLTNVAFADTPAPSKDFTVVGGIIDNPCVVSLAPSMIKFDNVDISAIRTSNSVAKDNQLLDVQISGCPEGDSVSVTFTGNAASVDATALATEDELDGAAKNVAIAFWDEGQQDTKVDINSGASHTAITTTKDTHIPFVIGLVINDYTKSVTAGTVAAATQVQVNFL